MDVDTRTVPARERLDYWHDSVCDSFVPLLATPASRDMHGRIRSTEIAETKVRRIAGTEHRFERRKQDIRRSSGPDLLNLVFLNGGSTVVEQDDRTAILTPGDFLFYDSARPFDFRSRGPFDYTILLMPKHLLALTEQVYATCTVRPQSCRDPRGAATRKLVASLVGPDAPEPDADRDPALQESVLHAVSTMIPTTGIAPTADTVVAIARAHIRRHLPDPDLSPTTVAAACGISVSYLHRLFAGEHETVAALIREERLQAALQRLTSPAHRFESVAAIGRACGLEDPAHFSRVMRNRFGASPRDLRRGTSRPAGA